MLIKEIWAEIIYICALLISGAIMTSIGFSTDTWQNWAVCASIIAAHITGRFTRLYKVYKRDYIKGIKDILEQAVKTRERHCFKADIRDGEVLMSVSEELIILHTFETTKNGSKRATYELPNIDDATQKLADLGVNLETIRHGWMR